MAFPATGMEAAYRNDGTQVAALLKESHPGHFLIYNLTERKYDTTMFEGRVRLEPIVSHNDEKQDARTFRGALHAL
jgi:DnaJ family protein C protein 6